MSHLLLRHYMISMVLVISVFFIGKRTTYAQVSPINLHVINAPDSTQPNTFNCDDDIQIRWTDSPVWPNPWCEECEYMYYTKYICSFSGISNNEQVSGISDSIQPAPNWVTYILPGDSAVKDDFFNPSSSIIFGYNLPYDFTGTITITIYNFANVDDNNSWHRTNSITLNLNPWRRPPIRNRADSLYITGTMHYNCFINNLSDSPLLDPAPLLKNAPIELYEIFNYKTNDLNGILLGISVTDSNGNFTFPKVETSSIVNLFIRAYAKVLQDTSVVCQALHNDTIYHVDTELIQIYDNQVSNDTAFMGNQMLPPPVHGESMDDVGSDDKNAIKAVQEIGIIGLNWAKDTINFDCHSFDIDGNINDKKIHIEINHNSNYITNFNVPYLSTPTITFNTDDIKNKDIVLHEFGHYLAYKMGIDKTSSELSLQNIFGRESHNLNQNFDNIEQAWSEGWADFFATAVLRTENRENAEPYGSSFYRQQLQISEYLDYQYDLESGQESSPGTNGYNVNANGDLNQGSTACLLWDIYDKTEDHNGSSTLGTLAADRIEASDRLWARLKDTFFPYQIGVGGWTGFLSRHVRNASELYKLWLKKNFSDRRSLYWVYQEHGFTDEDKYPKPTDLYGSLHWREDDETSTFTWNPISLSNGLSLNKVYRKTNSGSPILISGNDPITTSSFTDNLPYSFGNTYEYSVTSALDENAQVMSSPIFASISFGGNLPTDKRGNYTKDYIFQPTSLGNNDTLAIFPTTSLIFGETGKITVNSGAVLQFVACNDTIDTLGAMSHVILDSGATLSNPAIEVLPGGKVIGKHAHFENLPIAIHNQGGIVELDSCEFVNCAHPIIDTLQTDTLTLTNTKFINDSNGVAVYGTQMDTTRPVSIRNCSFHKIANIAISLDAVAGKSYISQCTIDTTKYAVEISNLKQNVMLDSCNITADNGVYAGTSLYTRDTLLMRHDTIQSGYISWFHTAVTVKADSCVFLSDTTGTGYGVVFDNESMLDHNGKERVHISNTKISGFMYGAWMLYSSPVIESCEIFNNTKAGVDWDHSDTSHVDSSFGLITKCEIYNNGGTGYTKPGGLYLAGSSPTITCNHLYSNLPNDCYINNGGRPKFKDTVDLKVGANLFEGDNARLIYVSSAHPDFENGGNTFVLGQSTLYGYGTNSGTIVLSGNYFDPPPTSNNFSSYNTSWDTSNLSSSGSECGATLSNKRGEEPERKGGFVIDSLLQRFTQKQTTLKELLTYKGSDRKELLFSTTYQLDAEKDFSNADNVREVILKESNSYDSLRVRYDKYLSNWLLRTPKAKRKPFEYENLEIARAMTDSMLALSQVMSPTQPEAPLPKSFKLYPVYPNPFNSTTRIHFDVPTSSKVKIIVYDALGRRVATLADKNFQAGSYHIEWNGNNASGMKVSSGVYFISMRSPSFVATKKAVLLK